MSDAWHDECGVFGIYNSLEAANLSYLGLHALQHRGQESAGIVTSDETIMRMQIGMGLVQEIFDEETIARLPGVHAIGHVRYSTTGSSVIKNAQPFYADTVHGPIAIAHNGNLVNAGTLRRNLEGRGSIFQTTNDTEVIAPSVSGANSSHGGAGTASVGDSLTPCACSCAPSCTASAASGPSSTTGS